jgi:DNA-binding transcriptional MerR regulator
MKTETLFTIGDIARQLNVPQHRIAYLIQRGRAHESFRLSGRRVFTEADMAHIAKQLNRPNEAGRPPRRKGKHEQ